MNSMQKLVGKKVVKVVHSEDSEVLAFFLDDGKALAWQAVGDCCANAYFYQMSDFEVLKGEVVTAVEEGEWSSKEDGDCSQLDTVFVRICTRLGRATIEFRVSHNGYYGGHPEPCDVSSLGSDAKEVTT